MFFKNETQKHGKELEKNILKGKQKSLPGTHVKDQDIVNKGETLCYREELQTSFKKPCNAPWTSKSSRRDGPHTGWLLPSNKHRVAQIE